MTLDREITVKDHLLETPTEVFASGNSAEAPFLSLVRMSRLDASDYGEEFCVSQEFEHQAQFVIPANFNSENNVDLLSYQVDTLTLFGTWLASANIMPKLFCQYAIQLCDILAQVHQKGYLMNGIFPDRFLLNEKTETLTLFNYRYFSQVDAYVPTDRLGSEDLLPYISPEHTKRTNFAVDYRSDYFSLGALFYEMATGRSLYESKDPLSIMHNLLAKSVDFSRIYHVPEAIQRVIVTLLEKSPDKRYQSLIGVKKDLLRIQENLDCSLDQLTLGQYQGSSVLKGNYSVFGREKEIESLMASFEKAKNGQCSWVAVSGDPGVGKTSLVKRVIQNAVQQFAYVSSVKCNANYKHMPFYPILTLCRDLLKRYVDQGDQQQWSQMFMTIPDEEFVLLVQEIPELSVFRAVNMALPDMTFEIRRRRFLRALFMFLEVFSKADYPLVIFIDDLHSSDYDTLAFLRYLSDKVETRANLAVWLTYRAKEVSRNHPVKKLLQEIDQDSSLVEMYCEALNKEGLTRLLHEVLGNVQADALTEILYRKTLGNPFECLQLLQDFYQKKFLWFDHFTGWQWEMSKIQQYQIPEDVVDLIVQKYKSFPDPLQELIHLASFFGQYVELEELRKFTMLNDEGLEQGVATCVSLGVFNVIEAGVKQSVFSFAHDKLLQAAYELRPLEDREAFHVTLANYYKILYEETGQNQALYLTVQHYHQGASKLEQANYQAFLSLSLLAVTAAIDHSAFQMGFSFANQGMAFVKEVYWKSDLQFMYNYYSKAALSAFLSDNIPEAKAWIKALSEQPLSRIQFTETYYLAIRMNQRLDANEASYLVAKKALGMYNKLFMKTKLIKVLTLAVFLSIVKVKFLFHKPENIPSMPEVTEEGDKVYQGLLGAMMLSLYAYDQDLVGLTVMYILSHTLSKGVGPYTAVGAIGYAFLPFQFGNYKRGIFFSQMAYDLHIRFPNSIASGTVLTLYYALLGPWFMSYDECLAGLIAARQLCVESGDLWFESVTNYFTLFLSFYASSRLSTMLSYFDQYDKFYLRNDAMHSPNYHGYKAFIKALTEGDTPLETRDLDEMAYLVGYEQDFSAVNYVLSFALMVYCFSAQYAKAQDLVGTIRKSISKSIGTPVYEAFHVFEAIALLMPICVNPSLKLASSKRRRVEKTLKKLNAWSEHCEANFLHKYWLVKALLAWANRDLLAAQSDFKQVLTLSNQHHYVMYVALVNEMLIELYHQMSLDEVRSMVFNQALMAYERWGATTKVDQLKRFYPEYVKETQRKPVGSMALSDHVDMLSLVESSQLISEELDTQSLFGNLLKVVTTNVGATRGVLLIKSHGELLVQGEYYSDRNDVEIFEDCRLETYREVPKTVLDSVQQIREPIVCHHASVDWHRHDLYFLQHPTKSMFCIPIIRQQKFVGILYLENNLGEGLFTNQHREIVDVLASQAAISIQNAALYNENKDLIQNLENRVAEQVKEIKEATEEKEKSIEMAERVSQQAAYATLTRGIAHEIRNPLAMMLSGVELTIDNSEDKALVEKFGNIIKQSIIRLRDITSAMLRYGSPVKENREALSINTILRDTVLMASVEAKLQHITFTEAYGDIPEIMGDPSSLGQAYLNIILNAMQAIHGEGVITITTGFKTFIDPDQQETEGVYVQIKDTGEGISEENLKKIVDPFYTTKYGNTGLGLAIVLRTIAEHKGIVDFASELGEGTTVTICLPKILPEA